MTVERHSLHRILKGTAESLSLLVYEDGVVKDPGTTTVTITMADGTAIVTGGATTGSGAQARAYALTTTDTANLDLLTAVWTTENYGAQTTTAEIVGEHLFTLAQARDFDGGKLRDASAYSDDLLKETRARILDAFAEVCGVSFVPRYKRVVLDGKGSDTLYLPDLYVTAIRSVDERASGGTDWTAYTSDDLADVFCDDSGQVFRETDGAFTAGRRNIRIGYEYGYAQPPLEITRAALRLLVSYLGATRTDWDPRAISMSTDMGVISLATAGMRGAVFGLPEVDSALVRYNERRAGIG